MENNRSKEKNALYLIVYNKILKNIQEGLYSENNKLPSENALAKQMDVSRMTLRQSLMLLQEDGIIESRKGVGNFIRVTNDGNMFGLEQAGDVLKKCGIDHIDKITCKFKLGPSAEYTDTFFDRKVPVFLATTLYFYYEKECCARCFSLIATDAEFMKEVDLSDTKEIQQLVTDDIYQYTRIVKYDIKILQDKESYRNANLKAQDGLYTLVTEKLIGEAGFVLCINKYYIPVESTNIKVTGFKK